MKEESKKFTCPIHFDEKYRTNADEELKKAYEHERFQIQISQNEQMNGSKLSEKTVEEERIKEGSLGKREFTRPIHFDEKYQINTDEEFKQAHEYEKSQRSVRESEKEEKRRQAAQQFHFDGKTEAETSEPLEDRAAARSEVKKDLLDSSETALPPVLDIKCLENHAKQRKAESCPIYFRAAEMQLDATFSERYVSESEAKTVIIPEEVIRELTGNSALELTGNETIGRDVSDMLSKKFKKALKARSSELANFDVIPEKVIYYMDRDGKRTEKGEVTCCLTMKEEFGVTEKRFQIRLDKIRELVQYVLKRYPEAIIYTPGSKSERAIENRFRKRISKTVSENCYVNAGWNLVNEKHVYIFKALNHPGIMTNTALNLPIDFRIQSGDLPDIIEQISMLYRERGTMYTMMAYSFLGVFYKIFEEAGYPPRFLLFLQGVSGSMKTSMAKVLYTQLCEDDCRQYPRRLDTDTEASMERGLIQKGQDTVTLFDDYAPPKTAQKGNEMRNKLETLIRMAGDGSTKSRSNTSLEDRRGEGLKGMIVVTGELKGTGLSSNLRCLYCEIKKAAVDTAVLSWLQERGDIYTTIIYHVTVYMSARWNELVEYIKEQFAVYRQEARADVHVGRMVDILATLWLTMDLVGMFLQEYSGRSWNGEYIKAVKDKLRNLVVANEEMSVEEDPAETFVDALAVMINNNQMNIVDYKDRTRILEGADGYCNGEYYYLLPDRVYQKIVVWLGKCGKEFTLNQDQIIKVLGDSEKIVTISNGRGKKTNFSKIKINGRQIKLLKISENVLNRAREKDSL